VQNIKKYEEPLSRSSWEQADNLPSPFRKSITGIRITLLSLLFSILIVAPPNQLFSSGLDHHSSGSALAAGRGQTWRDKTLALLERAHAWSGSYSSILTGSTYDPYTTYYTVLAYKEIGNPIPNADMTIKALKASQGEDGSFQCEKLASGRTESQMDKIGCIYYSVMTLDALGTHPNNVQETIRHINALQSQAGVYAFNTDVLNKINGSSPDIHTDILATRQALTVLKTLNGEPLRKESLKNWLLSQWNNNAHFPKVQLQGKKAFSSQAGIAESLEYLGIQVRQLPNASARLNWAKSLRNSILNLKLGSQNTNLMLSANWLELMQRLSGKRKDGHLIDANFCSQLTKFQQLSGGFSPFLTDDPDIKGTYVAAKLFRGAGQDIPRSEDISALLNRQALDKGGFLPVYQVGYSGPSFTNMSLDIRALLGANSTDDVTLKMFAKRSLTAFLKDRNEALSSGSARNLYHNYLLAKRTRIDTTPLAPILNQKVAVLIDGLKENQPLDGAQLQEAYYLTKLVQFEPSAVRKLEQNLLLMQNQDGVFGVSGSYALQINWLALGILDNLKSNILTQQMRDLNSAWIHKHQSAEGGYREANITNIYSSYWASDSLRILEGKVGTDPKLLAWIRSLALPDGGIKVTTADSGADTTGTYYALTITQMMGAVLE
jgi:hypothetical protein